MPRLDTDDRPREAKRWRSRHALRLDAVRGNYSTAVDSNLGRFIRQDEKETDLVNQGNAEGFVHWTTRNPFAESDETAPYLCMRAQRLTAVIAASEMILRIRTKGMSTRVRAHCDAAADDAGHTSILNRTIGCLRKGMSYRAAPRAALQR